MKNKSDQAIEYVELGFSVIPVRPDKRPLIRWQEYQQKRANKRQIRKWWSQWPNANVGIVTGSISGIMVVDVDSQTGHDTLNNYLPENLLTPVVNTPSGGWHYYFRYKKGLVNRARTITDCDVRTDGGYIVAPGSCGKNGLAYSWLKNLDLHEVEPTEMPESLFSVLKNGSHCQNSSPSEQIKDNMHLKEGCREERRSDTNDLVNNGQQMSTFDNILFAKGGRDEALFHLANNLVKSGMPIANIQEYMHFFGSHCSPPFPKKEIQTKIQSALNRSENRERNLTQDIRDLILSTSGNITTTFIYQCQHLTTRDEKKKAGVVLGRLVKDGLIERTGTQAGVYRRVEAECESMDFLNANTETTDLWLPFNLHQMVETMPGNIILIAGEPNSGKTGLLLNIIRSNMNRGEIHYFNSEMGSSELKKRLSLFEDTLLHQWKFNAWERSDNFADVIKAGKGKINIIDFLELHENFYEVGGRLAEIHKKLKGAIAIIALQKNAGVDTGLGGFRGLEKPRLYLAMSPGKLKIVKAKNWKSSENPNGKQVTFKVVKGCNFILQKNWHKA